MAQEQEQKHKQGATEQDSEVRRKFEALKANKIARTRKVKLKAILSCGCGDGFVEIEREVDEDSPLRDGDIIGGTEEIMKTDSVLSSNSPGVLMGLFMETIFK